MNIVGREPAQIAALLAAVIQVASLFLHLSVDQQGGLNAVAVALAGIGTALAVSQERAAPLIAGLLQSVLACALAFGVQMPAGAQSTLMAFVAALASWWLRTQVTAPVQLTPVAGRHEAA